jgi:site-specific recombinase
MKSNKEFEEMAKAVYGGGLALNLTPLLKDQSLATSTGAIEGNIGLGISAGFAGIGFKMIDKIGKVR